MTTDTYEADVFVTSIEVEALDVSTPSQPALVAGYRTVSGVIVDGEDHGAHVEWTLRPDEPAPELGRSVRRMITRQVHARRDVTLTT